MNPFEEILRSLGELMGLHLLPDANQACRLRITESFAIQIDLGKDADQILVGAQLGNLRAGSYRDQILLEALRTNGRALIPQGILSFSTKSNSLYLFQYLPLVHLDGRKLLDFLERFTKHALIWHEALSKEQNPERELETLFV